MKCKGKDVRGGHADTKEDREIKKDVRKDEKEKARGLPHSPSVLVLKKKAKKKREPPGPQDGFSCFMMQTHSRTHSTEDTFRFHVSFLKITYL